MTERVRSALAFGAGLASGVALGFLAWGLRGTGVAFSRAYRDGQLVRVACAIDGDTVALEDGVHVRYHGCDAPETLKFVKDPQPVSLEAASRNRQLVEGAWVRLRFPPPSERPLDPHGRMIADLVPDAPRGEETPTVAETLLREGLARVSVFGLPVRIGDRCREAEEEARKAGLGIWAPATGAASPAGPVATRRGRLFHRPSCAYAAKIPPENLLRFGTEAEALAKGFTRCPTCLSARGAQAGPSAAGLPAATHAAQAGDGDAAPGGGAPAGPPRQ